MKAAVMHAVNQPLVIEDVPEPVLDYGEVLVATKACGICGTDLHIIDGTGYKPKLPHILGHEPAGVVAKIGQGVTKFKLGDRVVPNIFFTCGECFFCRINRETMCTNFKGALGVGINGGYAEYFKAPAKNLFILPDKIGFNEGSVIADAVVTSVHAVRRRAVVKADDVVVVIGLGGVGQSVIQIAKHSGAKVYGVARRAQRVQVGEKFGADHIINSSVEDVGQAVNALTNGNGADIVIDNVGTHQTLMQALSAVHRGGRIVMVGETEDTIPLSTFKLCVNELDVLGSRSGGRQDTVEAIQLVESGVVTPFASDVFPLEQINEAFDSIKQGKIMGRAVISLEKS
ncbi:MAG: alcohol dehydrogenase catalytic domain-containing protein [Nitrososphaerales archaeon]